MGTLKPSISVTHQTFGLLTAWGITGASYRFAYALNLYNTEFRNQLELGLGGGVRAGDL